MTTKKLISAIVLVFISLTGTALAKTEIAPDTLLKTTTYKLIDGLKASRDELKDNPQIVVDLVTTHIAPQLDFIAASRWVLGKHWPKTAREQKIRFIKEFRKLLIQFYSVALSEYLINNDIEHGVIKYSPIKGEINDTDLTIHSIVSPPNSSKKVAVNYHMHKTRKGWKIYDVAVEGISMIGTYKSSFEQQLNNRGIDSLINSLIERNDKLALEKSGFKAKKVATK